MNLAFILNDTRAIPLMHQLAYRNNKKPGEGLAEEAIAVAQRHPEWITLIGNTDMDADQLTGELREQGVKVRNLNEEERRKKNV
jgi:hypothetical protein